MISLRELNYVFGWANRVPYPGIDYSEEALDDMIDSYNLFCNNYQGREYNIIFSDGYEIKFGILNMNIAHMLGINYKNLASDYHERFRREALDINPDEYISSFDMLTLIKDNKNKVLYYDREVTPIFNAYKLKVKSAIFNKLSDFSKFTFGCINFNKEQFIALNNRSLNSNSTKYLFVPSNEEMCPYFMMGLKEDDDKDMYIVETLIAPTEPSHFFNGQEVVIPTQILKSDDDNLTKSCATADEKIHLLNLYKSIIMSYNLPNQINIYGDYTSTLNDISNGRYVKTKKIEN